MKEKGISTEEAVEALETIQECVQLINAYGKERGADNVTSLLIVGAVDTGDDNLRCITGIVGSRIDVTTLVTREILTNPLFKEILELAVCYKESSQNKLL